MEYSSDELMVCIPTLELDDFKTDAWHHECRFPKLEEKTLEPNGDFWFSWTMQGSGESEYQIKAQGNLESGWKCDCTCPSGKRLSQSKAKPQSQPKAPPEVVVEVCKHAYSALSSVCDPRYSASQLEREHRAASDEEEKEEEKEELENSARERLYSILTTLNPEEVDSILKDSMMSTEGLSALEVIFPVGFDPMPLRECLRCEMVVDPDLEPDCAREHLESRTVWNGSEAGYKVCHKCNATFGAFGGMEIEDAGPICYQGSHKLAKRPRYDSWGYAEEEDDDDDENSDHSFSYGDSY